MGSIVRLLLHRELSSLSLEMGWTIRLRSNGLTSALPWEYPEVTYQSKPPTWSYWTTTSLPSWLVSKKVVVLTCVHLFFVQRMVCCVTVYFVQALLQVHKTLATRSVAASSWFSAENCEPFVKVFSLFQKSGSGLQLNSFNVGLIAFQIHLQLFSCFQKRIKKNRLKK